MCKGMSRQNIDNSQITHELTTILEGDLNPEDVMQIDLLPNFPPSGGY